MRNFSSALRQHLQSETTNLCYCWKIIRKDGFSLGFTDHDKDIFLHDICFQSQNSLAVNAVENSIGFQSVGAHISGALSSDLISIEDLDAHLYDNATLETWVVNWADINQNFLLDISIFGDVTKGDFSYHVNVSTMASLFDQTKGRYYQIECPLKLGDVQCTVDLNSPNYFAYAEVQRIISSSQIIVKASGYNSLWFQSGTLIFVDDHHKTHSLLIKEHMQLNDLATLTLWDNLPTSIPISSQVQLIAGCNKTLSMCSAKFKNQNNYRGFPHIPGNDILMSFANQYSLMDGGSLFR